MRSFLLLVVALSSAASVGTSSASAQAGFSVQRWRMPASADDGFGLYAPYTPGHLVLDARLGLDFAHAPLVLSEVRGDERTRTSAVVDASFSTDIAIGLGIIDRLAAWIALPIVLYQGGDAATAVPSAQAVGDFEIGIRGWLFGERAPAEGFAPNLGLVGALVLPTGSAESLSGDGSVGFRAALSAGLAHAVVTPILNFGFAYRPERTYQTFASAGSELTYGLGVHVSLEPVRIEGELRGATTVTGPSAFQNDGTALELLVGLHARVASVLRLGVAVDLGLSQAPGVPDVRVLGTIGLAVPLVSDSGESTEDEEETTDAGGADGDGGHVVHAQDGDSDDDGIADGDDFCPNEAETRNEYNDDDGCPDDVVVEGTMLVPSEPILFPARAVRVEGDVAEGLRVIANALEQHAEIRLVQIEGHAASDETGNNRRALALSEGRAQAVLEWLVGHGVSSDRLTFVGLGADQPADPDDQDKNRRVTFRILEQRE